MPKYNVIGTLIVNVETTQMRNSPLPTDIIVSTIPDHPNHELCFRHRYAYRNASHAVNHMSNINVLLYMGNVQPPIEEIQILDPGTDARTAIPIYVNAHKVDEPLLEENEIATGTIVSFIQLIEYEGPPKGAKNSKLEIQPSRSRALNAVKPAEQIIHGAKIFETLELIETPDEFRALLAACIPATPEPEFPDTANFNEESLAYSGSSSMSLAPSSFSILGAILSAFKMHLYRGKIADDRDSEKPELEINIIIPRSDIRSYFPPANPHRNNKRKREEEDDAISLRPSKRRIRRDCFSVDFFGYGFSFQLYYPNI